MDLGLDEGRDLLGTEGWGKGSGCAREREGRE